MKNNKNEQFFTTLAKSYVEKDGKALQRELSEMKEEVDDHGLNKKIKRRLMSHRFVSYGAFAASIIALMLVYNSYTGMNSTNSGAPSNASSDTQTMDNLRYSVELLTASLPTGYTMTGVDYDNYAAIMEIENQKNNRIIVTAEEYNDFYKDGLHEIEINGVITYGAVKNDYCVLKYSKDNILYTLTSLYEIEDLIEISKNIL